MKQAIVVRVDLGMSTGKLAAQAFHASVAAAFAARKDDLSRWLGEGQTKVALKTSSLEALFELLEQCDALGLARVNFGCRTYRVAVRYAHGPRYRTCGLQDR